MNEPILARWLRWLVFASALIPLVIFSQYISPFHFGKVVLFRSIVQVMVALYLLLIWRHPEYRIKGHPILWTFLAFAVVFTVTSLTSVAPIQSVWGTLERMGGMFTFWHYFVFFLIVVSVMRTRGHWQQLIDLMVAVGIISAIYGLLQKTDWSIILGSGNRSRPFGTIGNAALFAGYQIVIAFLATTMLLTRKQGPNAVAVYDDPVSRGGLLVGVGLIGSVMIGLFATPLEWLSGLWIVPVGLVSWGVYTFAVAAGVKYARWFYGGAAALMLFAVFTTAVRGSLLAVIVAVLVAAALWAAAFRSRAGKMALLGGVTAVILFVFIGSLLRNTPIVQNSPYLSRVTAFSPQTFTVQTRFWAWSAGLQGWSESPKTILLGWGPENFNVPFSMHFNPKFFQGPGSETFFDRAHNMFMEVLVTMGLFGELTYLALFVAVLWTLMRWAGKRVADDPQHHDLKVIGIGLAALTIAYAIHNSFIFDTSANYVVFFTVLAFIVHVAWRGLQGDGRSVAGKKSYAWTGTQMSAAAVLGVVALIAVYSTNIRPTMANYSATRAIIAGWQGDWVTSVNKYREAIDADTPGRYEFRHRYAQYLLELSGAADVSKVPNFKEAALRAIEDVQKNVDENPEDYLPLLYMSRLYIILGKDDPASPYNDKALEMTQRALEISPTFVRTYYEVAQAYLNKKDAEKALEWFKKAAELNPDVGITYWYIGSVRFQVAQEQQDAAGVQEALGYINMALAKGYGLSESDGAKLSQIFLQLGDYKNLAVVTEQLVATSPMKADYWLQLVGAYVKLNDVPRAQDAAKRSLSIPEAAADPAYRQKLNDALAPLGIKM